ncbi:CpaF family protein [Arenivirga flava]|uniref:Type II secretion system protein E n=1 Tax=Arenivirga flava TaxID=1930060 RepID=A0AA37UG91_9MICO|nr:CpaF family protein [Arenivirga flava]GMA28825.1 type II secretion system protein E [Arenivirga flava]
MSSLSERLQAARNRRAQAERPIDPSVLAEAAPADWTPEWDAVDGPGWGSAAEPEPGWLAEGPQDRDGADEPASAPSMPPVEDLYDGAALAVIPRRDGGADDEVQRVREEASDLFAERIGTRLNDPALSESDLDAMARRELASIIDERGQTLSERQRFALIQELADEVLGLGPIEPLLDDETVSEVMVNGHDHVYVERRGRIQRVPTTFRSEERLRRVIERIVTRVGRRIDESSPFVDARLADGSRVNAVIPPLAIGGSSLTIRKFATEPLRARDLVSLGTVGDDMIELLVACVRARLNVIVAGGTGTGKTTLLNVLSSFIPHDERIITIEDAAELQLQQEHVVRLESRPPNVEGRGEVTIRDLVRNALRMRPDRIVVGESRGGESLDMLQAMSTGHDGSLTTLHANSPRDALARLETLVMMAGMELPHRAIREQIASSIDVIIQVTRLRDGTRRVTHVTEVLGMEHDTVTLQDIYRFDFGAGVDASGRFLGRALPTGIRPRFLTRFDELGVPFDASLFATAADRSDRA